MKLRLLKVIFTLAVVIGSAISLAACEEVTDPGPNDLSAVDQKG